MRSTVGQVLRRGNGVYAGQVGHLTKHVCQCATHPLAHSRKRSAKSGELSFSDAAHLRTVLEEGGGHRPRLVHIEIDANAVLLGPLDQSRKIGQTALVADSKFGKGCATGGQISQHGVQPNTVDPYGGKPLEKSIRIGIQLGIGQRITVHGYIGIDKPQANRPIFPRDWRGKGKRRAELPHKVETGF